MKLLFDLEVVPTHVGVNRRSRINRVRPAQRSCTHGLTPLLVPGRRLGSAWMKRNPPWHKRRGQANFGATSVAGSLVSCLTVSCLPVRGLGACESFKFNEGPPQDVALALADAVRHLAWVETHATKTHTLLVVR